MNYSRKAFLTFLFAGTLLSAAVPAVVAEYDSKSTVEAQSTTETETPMDMSQEMMPLGEFLQSQPDLSTLYTALQEADLITTLEELDAYTIFAPTNEAFDALPPGQLDALLAEPETLKKVLQFHVVEESLSSSDLESMEYDSLEGTPLMVEVGEEVMVDGASVLETDLSTEKGKVHTIDTVLVPENVTLPEPTADSMN